MSHDVSLMIVSSIIQAYRRRSSVNFRGQEIFARKKINMYEEITKCPNFTFARKISKIPELL